MASDYQPRSTMVYVTEHITDGQGTRTVCWSYNANKNTHFGNKLGRRVGKHGPQRLAHCTEGEAIRAMYHRKEVNCGFQQHRAGLVRLRERQHRKEASLTKEQRDAIILAADRQREMMSILCPTPPAPKIPVKAKASRVMLSDHLEV